MADQFGALALPAPTTDSPIGDPGLKRLGDFLQASINAYTDAAWAIANPGPLTPERLTARSVHLFNPRENGFNENALPALFVWRAEGKSSDLASADWLVDDVQIHAMWAMPLMPQEKQRTRGLFMNAVAKTVEHALNQGRIAAWFDPADPDVTAAPRAASANAILLSKGTSTSPVDYSGGGLDGALGASVLAPRRNLTLTTAVAATAKFSTSNPLVITYKDALGRTTTRSIQPTNDHGGQTLLFGADAAQVVSVHVPAQFATGGSFSIGVAAWVGRGSSLDRAGFAMAVLDSWKFGHEKIDVLNSAQRAIEHAGIFALDMTISAREVAITDPLNAIRYPYSGAAHELVSVHQSDAVFVPTVDLT